MAKNSKNEYQSSNVKNSKNSTNSKNRMTNSENSKICHNNKTSDCGKNYSEDYSENSYDSKY